MYRDSCGQSRPKPRLCGGVGPLMKTPFSVVLRADGSFTLLYGLTVSFHFDFSVINLQFSMNSLFLLVDALIQPPSCITLHHSYFLHLSYFFFASFCIETLLALWLHQPFLLQYLLFQSGDWLLTVRQSHIEKEHSHGVVADEGIAFLDLYQNHNL